VSPSSNQRATLRERFIEGRKKRRGKRNWKMGEERVGKAQKSSRKTSDTGTGIVG
jgi:hypothetical protein